MISTHLSLVIPMYNEETRIGSTLEKALVYLRSQKYTWEIIVVDDGSSDRSVSVAEKILEGAAGRVLKNPENRGKGYSVKRGMLEAEGEYIIFSDADLSTPIEESEGFLAELKSRYDIVIGSRALKDSRIEVRQSQARELMGKTFNKLARLLAFRDIHDSQCGFKGFRRIAAHDLFSRQKIDGFSFDVEVLYLAQKSGYSILEKPVRWQHVEQSRVRLVSDPLKMFLDLVKIRWIHRS